MAITLTVSDNTVANFVLSNVNEAVLLEANDSGVTLTAETSESISMSVESAEVTLTAEPSIVISGGDIYTGAYELTPTTETQTIPISGKTASRNITINPIPSNYGLITWNGSTLTVS